MMKKIAAIFPGQGSQAVGMASDLSKVFPVVKETFNTASRILGYDLWQLAQEGPLEQLNQTEYTQPALLAVDVAIWRCWKATGGCDPVVAAGHSLGEYSALVAAGSLNFEDAVQLVAHRGRFMQQAVPIGEGAMAAIIGLDADAVIALCLEATAAHGLVAPANFNSIGQLVVSGTKAGVDAVVATAKPAGARIAKRLPVSVPSHCALMQSAADQLAKSFEGIVINAPAFPVLNNTHVAIESSPEAIKQALLAQLTSPVRWVETVQAIIALGVQDAVECGPGKVLAGLNKRIDSNMTTFMISTPSALTNTLSVIRGET